MHHRRRRQIDGLPPLQSFCLELNVFRALLRDPANHLRLSRHYTLSKNRWFSAERVAKVALRDGYTTEAVIGLLAETLAEFAPAEFEYTPSCVAEVVKSVLNPPRKWVIHPGNSRWPRTIGVMP